MWSEWVRRLPLVAGVLLRDSRRFAGVARFAECSTLV